MTMNRERRFWVYIVASKSRRIYTGMANNLGRRVREHKAGEIEGFTQQYKINRLVYYEGFRYVGNAINREKQIKRLDRAKRVALIESMNPTWEDLPLEWGKPVELLHPSAAAEQQIPRGLKPARDDNFDCAVSVPDQDKPRVTKK
jgi:putative endonuclease